LKKVKKVMKKILLLLLAMSITGCTTLESRVGPKLSKAISDYCMQPQANRALLRQEVNGLIKPNSAQINCAADTQP
jgi:hypothetical protein